MSKSLQYAAMVNYFNSLLAEDEPLSEDPSAELSPSAFRDLISPVRPSAEELPSR